MMVTTVTMIMMVSTLQVGSPRTVTAAGGISVAAQGCLYKQQARNNPAHSRAPSMGSSMGGTSTAPGP